MNTIDVVERAVTEHSTVWAAYAKSLHRKIAKLRNANRELEASCRKLAEREKALTEALEALVAERGGGKKHCGHEYDCICTRDLVRAALALHKEDA